MSWGTSFVLRDDYSHVGMNDAGDTETERRIIEDAWRRITILAAMSPYDMKDEDGRPVEWARYIDGEIRELREAIEEEMSSLHVKTTLEKVKEQGELLHIRICENGHAQFYDPESKYDLDSKCDECGAPFLHSGTMRTWVEG